MSDDKRARLKQWLESGEARLQPLTLPQRELWECSPVPPGSPENHISALVHIRGLLTTPDCRAAFEKVVERQEVLRLSILPGKDRPLQMVRKTMEGGVHFRDLTTAESTPEGVEAVAQEIAAQPFDLVQGPLYSANVFRRAVDSHVLMISIHHSIADGWSLGVFLQDLVGAYIQRIMGLQDALPEVAQTYTAWGAADRAYWTQAELDRRIPFWREKLAGHRRLWSPDANPSPLQRWLAYVSAEPTQGARDLARRHGTTLYSTLLTCFQLALAKWTGEQDLIVGSPIANRTTPGVRESMGCCAGIVPVRTQIDSSRPFAETLRTVHHETLDAFASAMPFAELVRALGEPVTPGRNPFFDVRFALQNHPVPEFSLPQISAKLTMRSTGTARFEIACEITEQGDILEVAWLYRESRFSLAEIQELNQLFQTTLAAAYVS